MTLNELPGTQTPYKLEAGEGQRFAFGGHLATVLARAEDMGISMAGCVLSGAKGSHFPLHRHDTTFEAIFVLEGSVAMSLDGKLYELVAGDYVSIPPGTEHGFSYRDHRGKLIAWTFNGNANQVYSRLGTPYPGTVYSELLAEPDWGMDLDDIDIHFKDATGPAAVPCDVKLSLAPGDAVPFVLAGGEGERMMAGEQMYTIMGAERASGGLFHCLMTEGPVGPAIPKHLHEHVTETFFCINGAMEMLAGDQVVTLTPGDFLHIPPGTPHKFQLLKNGTRFIGFLSPGSFEVFFRYLCQPFEGYIYPLVPPPFRFDRVIQHLSELDLKILERPGGAPPPHA